jgi:hypothetical protein
MQSIIKGRKHLARRELIAGGRIGGRYVSADYIFYLMIDAYNW